MPTLKADTVVIGGGIIGTAVAFELARRKTGRVILVEREKLLGTGATSRCAGGIRAQFSSEINCRVSQLSEHIFMNFEAEVGVPALYDQVGYLFCLTEPAHVEAFRRDLAMWQRLGLPAVWLSTEEIHRRLPELETSDVLGGTFCESDGLADSGEFMTAYEKQARRHGVTILSGQAVTGLATAAGRITAVKVGDTQIETARAINCAGPYAAEIGRFVDLDIPIVPLKRQICKTAPLEWVRADLPMIVDMGSGLYTHKESGGMLMGWADPSVRPGYDQSTDAAYTDEIILRALARLPLLETAAIASSWGGLYETTPDHHAIIGPVRDLEGFWICAGFSGHGFMHAPGAARLLAEWIADGRPSIDLSPLGFDRFAGAPAGAQEVNVI
jgi:sarcosine oxidase subunit beta